MNASLLNTSAQPIVRKRNPFADNSQEQRLLNDQNLARTAPWIADWIGADGTVRNRTWYATQEQAQNQCQRLVAKGFAAECYSQSSSRLQ